MTDKYRENKRRYECSEKGKIARKRYIESPKGKKTIRKVSIKYEESLKGKLTRFLYSYSLQGKERQRKYNNSKKGRKNRKEESHRNNKLRKKRYNNSPKGKYSIMISCFRRRQKFPINLSVEDAELIKRRDKMKCVYCGINVFEYPIVPKYHPQQLTFDHVDDKGATDLSNLVLSCRSCNSSKLNKNVFEWSKEKNIKIPKIIIDLKSKEVIESVRI